MKRIIFPLFLAITPFLMAGSCEEEAKKKSDEKQSSKEEIAKDVTAPETSVKETPKEHMVLIKTSFGNMKVKLYNETPQHRDNFIKLVKDSFYKDLLFHRVIAGFMIQGGDPDSRNAAPEKQLGMGGPGYTVPAEILPQFHHKKGALSAARLGDNMNPTKKSSGSQFYVVQGQKYTVEQLQQMEPYKGKKFTPEEIETYTTIGGTPHLDGQYTVFGEVVEGLDVIDKIAAVQTDPRTNRPVSDVKMDIQIVE